MTSNAARRDRRAGVDSAPKFGPLIAMLAVAIFFHAIDRGNLATVGPPIRDALKLSNTAFGLLLSAFFLTFVPGQLLAGWLIQKINAWRTLALGVLLWSVATVLTGFAQGFGMLLFLRLLLGLGECATFPASSKILAANLPSGRLGSANGMISAGLHLGNGAGVVLGGLLMARMGWRPLFIVTGLLTALWLIPWLGMGRPGASQTGDPEPVAEPEYRLLLRKRELWGAAIGQFALNYPYFLLVSWLPIYLVKTHGHSIATMAALAGSVYLLSTLCSLLAGYCSDRWMAAGASANRVRKSMVLASGVISLSCMLAAAQGSLSIAIAALLVYPVANGLAAVSIFAIGQTLAGPSAAGKWIAVQNGVGSLAGITAPIVTGVTMDCSGGFTWAFLVAAGIILIGLYCWGVVIGTVAPVVWDIRPAGHPAHEAMK